MLNQIETLIPCRRRLIPFAPDHEAAPAEVVADFVRQRSTRVLFISVADLSPTLMKYIPALRQISQTVPLEIHRRPPQNSNEMTETGRSESEPDSK